MKEKITGNMILGYAGHFIHRKEIECPAGGINSSDDSEKEVGEVLSNISFVIPIF